MNRLKSNKQNPHGIMKERGWKKNWLTLNKGKLFITLIINILYCIYMTYLFI